MVVQNSTAGKHCDYKIYYFDSLHKVVIKGDCKNYTSHALYQGCPRENLPKGETAQDRWLPNRKVTEGRDYPRYEVIQKRSS